MSLLEVLCPGLWSCAQAAPFPRNAHPLRGAEVQAPDLHLRMGPFLFPGVLCPAPAWVPGGKEQEDKQYGQGAWSEIDGAGWHWHETACTVMSLQVQRPWQ